MRAEMRDVIYSNGHLAYMAMSAQCLDLRSINFLSRRSPEHVNETQFNRVQNMSTPPRVPSSPRRLRRHHISNTNHKK